MLLAKVPWKQKTISKGTLKPVHGANQENISGGNVHQINTSNSPSNILQNYPSLSNYCQKYVGSRRQFQEELFSLRGVNQQRGSCEDLRLAEKQHQYSAGSCPPDDHPSINTAGRMGVRFATTSLCWPIHAWGSSWPEASGPIILLYIIFSQTIWWRVEDGVLLNIPLQIFSKFCFRKKVIINIVRQFRLLQAWVS